MLKANQAQLQYYATNNRAIPPEGPRAIPLTLDFSAGPDYSLDLQNIMARGFISMLQGIYIDNADNAQSTSVTFIHSGHRIICAPGRQGYFEVISPNPTTIIFHSNGAIVVPIQLLNYPVINHDWPSITGA